MKFSLDDKKAASNVIKHGVTFEEAEEALADRYRLEFFQRVNWPGPLEGAGVKLETAAGSDLHRRSVAQNNFRQRGREE